MAEAERFELSCPVKDNSISSRARYDHFDTPPYLGVWKTILTKYI